MKFITLETDEKISIEQYLEYINNEVDLYDHESVIRSAIKLKALANNEELISDIIFGLLESNEVEQNPYSEQTILLGSGEGFTVRANVWSPLSSDESMHTMEENLYSYNYAHDHNFSFLTVGFFGPGYDTELYEYDYNSCIGMIGEKISLKSIGKHRLAKGSIMYYQSGIDVHRQLPPESLSISINLLIHKHSERYQDQFEFDTRYDTIIAHTPNPSEARNFLLDLSKEFSDDETNELLLKIGKTHPSRRTRAGALAALYSIDYNKRAIEKIGRADESRYVQTTIDRLLS